MARRRLVVLATTCMMCLSLSVAWAKAKRVDPLELDPIEDTAEVPVESIQNFVQIYGIVKDNYVSEKNDEDLFQQAIQGLVSGLDRYSRYLSPEDYKQLLQYTEGDIASTDFDLVFDLHHHHWVIRGLKTDADSSKLGLKNGQAVFKIDDQEIKKLSAEQVSALLAGAVGSTVDVQLAAQIKPITLVRNKKIETDVSGHLLNNQILIIKVKVFQQDTANEIKKLIEQQNQNRLKGVLIDLRNNPGGLLSAAVESADLFLNQGIIVSTKSRSEGDQQFQALPSQDFQKLKIGILINGRSASAAEVFTAALKDHGRAWVMGEKSYGKGVVQKLFPLSNGAALQMTVSHYYTPKGKMIEGIGITPNQILNMQPEMKDELYIEQAAEILLKQK